VNWAVDVLDLAAAEILVADIQPIADLVAHGGGNADAAPAHKAAAQARAEAVRPVLVELAAKSTRQIAAELTARVIETPRGGRWQAQSVVNLQRHLGMAV
jgi:hypothetical protein